MTRTVHELGKERVVAEAHGLYLLADGEVWYVPEWVPDNPHVTAYRLARVDDVEGLAAEIRAAADWWDVLRIVDRWPGPITGA
jgi:hypothetical protein